MYKVFFKENSFLLTDDQNLLKEGNIHFIHQDFMATRQFIIRQLNSSIPFQAVMFSPDVEELLSIFKSCFTYVKAAGGCVIQEGKVLLIKRLGMYDLPKGHQETGETIEQCAIREVEEECGLHQLQITAPLSTTLHIYEREDNWFLKKTYWFRMHTVPHQSLTPQTEEDIEAAFWFPLCQLSDLSEQTYPSLREVFQKLQTEKAF